MLQGAKTGVEVTVLALLHLQKMIMKVFFFVEISALQ